MTSGNEEAMQEEATLPESQRSTDAADIIKETRDTLASLLETLPLLTHQYGPEGARAKVRAIVSIVLSGRSLDEEIEGLRKKDEDELRVLPCVICWQRYTTPGTVFYHNYAALVQCEWNSCA